jgi:hypothetical protein
MLVGEDLERSNLEDLSMSLRRGSHSATDAALGDRYSALLSRNEDVNNL